MMLTQEISLSAFWLSDRKALHKIELVSLPAVNNILEIYKIYMPYLNKDNIHI